MLNERTFQKRLSQQLIDFGLICKNAWTLAPNVFLAHLKDEKGRCEMFMFYYDNTVSKLRDTRLVNRTLQLLLMTDGGHGCLSQDEDDRIAVFYFDRELLSSPDNALNGASQMLLQADDKEIDWLDKPEAIEINSFEEVPDNSRDFLDVTERGCRLS